MLVRLFEKHTGYTMKRFRWAPARLALTAQELADDVDFLIELVVNETCARTRCGGAPRRQGLHRSSRSPASARVVADNGESE